ncbi:hypothetical protein RND81_11G062500 [Saponaria officinalis]|uniref:Retrotransposon gag domain-containing protein n=1 Tax=Saponaria officinalis TaxID=3572 RepID=A0AAW1HII2_SAPOF
MMYVSSSKQLWDEIEERCNQTNAPYLYQLRKNMVYIKQNGQPVVQYFEKLKSIWEDLNSLDPLPECDCEAIKACSCNILKKIVDRDNRNRLLDFLMGLDATYEVVRDRILSTDPLPTVNQAFFKIQQVEMQKNIHSNVYDAQENVAIDHKRSRGPLKCDYCGKRGHTRAYCFKLKAYHKGKCVANGDFKHRLAANVEGVHCQIKDTPLDAEIMHETDAKLPAPTNF